MLLFLLLVIGCRLLILRCFFKVRKSWMFGNDVDASTIVLKKLTGEGWVTLPTSLIDEEGSHFVYRSDVEGLSIFAVVGKRIKRVVEPEIVVEEPVVDEDVKFIEEIRAEPLVSAKRAGFALRTIFEFVIIFAILLLLIEVARKLHKKFG